MTLFQTKSTLVGLVQYGDDISCNFYIFSDGFIVFTQGDEGFDLFMGCSWFEE